MVPNVPSDPDSDPNLSEYSSSESSELPDNKYYKWLRGAIKDKNDLQSKPHFDDSIKNCAKVTAKLIMLCTNQRLLT